MSNRYTEAQVHQWREDGVVVIPRFFTNEEMAPILADYDELYGDRGAVPGADTGQPINQKEDGVIGAFTAEQFKNIDNLPYNASPSTNLISLHPQLIHFAAALLGVEKVFLYQSHTWAKYTGEADYDQVFHCDFGNHTLTVPSDDVRLRTVNFVFYITDVTDDCGPLHFVTKTDAASLLGPSRLFFTDEMQSAMQAQEHSAAGPVGTLIAYSIDTLHRGTNLTRLNGKRFSMTVSYKAAGNDMIGFHVWQYAPNRPWELIFNNADPQQLECLGIPLPGSSFWTPDTIAQTQERWPDWDMSIYRSAVNGDR